MTADFVQSDLGVVYSATLRNAEDDSLLDLTNRTVTLCFRINDGPVVRRNMTVESPSTAGNVTYTFGSGDLTESGILTAEIEITGAAASVTVVAGVNDKIDFGVDTFGAPTATVPPGIYINGAVLAAACVTAMEAETTDPVYTLNYDAGTQKFSITTDGITQYFFLIGPNFATSIHRSLGFPDADIGRNTTVVGSTSVPFIQVILTSRDPKQYVVRARV